MLIEIEDQLTETALQEFYLTAKQWLSDTDFMESEVLFLSRLIADQQDNGEHNFGLQIEGMRIQNEKLRPQIAKFIQLVNSNIVKAEQELAARLIDNFARLQQSAACALVKLKLLKYQVVNIQRAA